MTIEDELDQAIRDADGYWPEAKERIMPIIRRAQAEARLEARLEALNALLLPDEDARSGMIHARGLLAAHIIEQQGAEA